VGVTGLTTELINALPIPVAGQITGIGMCTDGTPTNTSTWTLDLNGVAQAMTVSQLSTDSSFGCKTDFVHGPVSVAAGNYIDFAYATGATTVSLPSNWFSVFVPTNGTSSVMGSIYDGTVAATQYQAIGAHHFNNSTEQNVTTVMPFACNATNLYVVMATAETGTNTVTLTLRNNLASTAVTGTVNAASGTGAIALYTGTPVAIAKGAQVDMMFTFANGTSGTIGGYAFSCN
jgi:hypothetical protein